MQPIPPLAPTSPSPNADFFYTSGSTVKIQNHGTSIHPKCINTYIIGPEDWKPIPKPQNFTNEDWASLTATSLLNVRAGTEKMPLMCLGKKCWNYSDGYGELCSSNAARFERQQTCTHAFEDWINGDLDWQSRFKLVETGNKGVGVQTKIPWRKDDVLGFYVGKILPQVPAVEDYSFKIPLGPKVGGRSKRSVGYVDETEYGNWTRFLNHSCDAHCVFGYYRAGDTLVVAIVAQKDIEANIEVTVNYGHIYFQERECLCGTRNCIEKAKMMMKRDNERKTKEVSNLRNVKTGRVSKRRKRLDWKAR